MKKIRAFRDEWTEDDVQFLAQLGIKANVGAKWDWIRIEEDERYFQIKKRCGHRWSCINDVIAYEYSKEEINAADYYIFKACNACGYPQPDWNFKYQSVSFDAEKICSECGCGRVQTDALRVNKVSKHGFWSFFAWIDDEFFVNEKVYNEVFAPYGIEKRDVVKGGNKLEGIFQLVIPIIDEPLELSDRKPSVCPTCGEIKYDITHRAYPFFPLHEHPIPGIYKTKEYFGAGRGHQADRVIIISKEVANKLIEFKDLKKEWLIPCKRFRAEDRLCTGRVLAAMPAVH